MKMEPKQVLVNFAVAIAFLSSAMFVSAWSEINRLKIVMKAQQYACLKIALQGGVVFQDK